MSVNQTYRDGRLAKIVVHEPTAVSIGDFRTGHQSEPFVSVHVHDGSTEVVLFLTPDLAEELGNALCQLPALEPAPDNEPS